MPPETNIWFVVVEHRGRDCTVERFDDEFVRDAWIARMEKRGYVEPEFKIRVFTATES